MYPIRRDFDTWKDFLWRDPNAHIQTVTTRRLWGNDVPNTVYSLEMQMDDTTKLVAQIEANWVLCSAPIKMRDGETSKLLMPLDIPDKPGIYRIHINEPKLSEFDSYVGEGQDIQDRVKKYENAGWHPEKLAFTNRMVQGWLVRAIRMDATVDLWHCTDAKFGVNGELQGSLDLGKKFNRLLIENSVFNHFKNERFLNKIARSD